MSSLIKKIISRMSDFDSDLKDDETRVKKMRIAWENGRDADAYRQETGCGIAEVAEACGIIHTTLQRFVRFYLMYKEGYAESLDGMPLMWGHYMAVLYVKEKAARDWYLKEAAANSWSTHEIRRRVRDHFYESTFYSPSAISDKPNALAFKEQKLYTYSARVLNVVDADTLKIEVDAGFSMRYETKVRLRGIDAYERGTTLGDEAKQFVENELFFGAQDHMNTGTQEGCLVHMCSGALVVLRSYKSDKYGRFLADVWYLKGETDAEKILNNGHFLNQVLLDKGYAVRV
jgi:micrococcal nuclease